MGRFCRVQGRIQKCFSSTSSLWLGSKPVARRPECGTLGDPVSMLYGPMDPNERFRARRDQTRRRKRRRRAAVLALLLTAVIVVVMGARFVADSQAPQRGSERSGGHDPPDRRSGPAACARSPSRSAAFTSPARWPRCPGSSASTSGTSGTASTRSSSTSRTKAARSGSRPPTCRSRAPSARPAPSTTRRRSSPSRTGTVST